MDSGRPVRRERGDRKEGGRTWVGRGGEGSCRSETAIASGWLAKLGSRGRLPAVSFVRCDAPEPGPLCPRPRALRRCGPGSRLGRGPRPEGLNGGPRGSRRVQSFLSAVYLVFCTLVLGLRLYKCVLCTAFIYRHKKISNATHRTREQLRKTWANSHQLGELSHSFIRNARLSAKCEVGG